jgi:hypothetical protein
MRINIRNFSSAVIEQFMVSRDYSSDAMTLY